VRPIDGSAPWLSDASSRRLDSKFPLSGEIVALVRLSGKVTYLSEPNPSLEQRHMAPIMSESSK